MAISVGDALLKLGVDTKDLDKGMKGLGDKIKKHHKAIGLGMTAIGGAILAAGALSIKTFAAMGDEVAKMALRTGFSTEALSELRHAAEISGASLSTLEKGVKKMSKTIVDASDGMATYVRSFDKIGLSAEELIDLAPEEQFKKITMAIAALENPTLRAAVAQDIFGRAGTELLPLLAEGAEGIEKLRQEAHELGIVFDQEAANKAAQFNDAMTRMNESVNGVKMVIAENLIPILLPLIDKIKEIVAGISAWMKKHPELTKGITLATGAVSGLLLVLGPLLIFLPQITAAFTILRGFIVARMIPSIIALTVALWGKVAALLAAVMAIAGPVGLGVALTGFAAIIAGTTLLIKHNMKEMAGLTGATDVLNESVQSATQAQKEYNLELLGLQEGLDGATQSQKNLNAEMEEAERLLLAQKVAVSSLMIAEAQRAELARFGFEKLEKLYAAQGIGIRRATGEFPWELVPITGQFGVKYAERLAGEELGETISRVLTQTGAILALEEAAIGFQHGGIAMRPMTARIAEKSPEAVIPLDRLQMGSGQMMTVILEVDGRQMAKTLMPYAIGETRLRQGLKI